MLKRSWAIIISELTNIFSFVKKLVFRIMHLADDTDIEGTIKGINSGVVLGGSKLWILICSVFIACIGLDVNSPAVIIGAMLISPLMSPILGVGLALGINDRVNFGRSLLNFGIATVLSLACSFLYFKVTPFGDFTPEMQARITPTILDALVALFGGLAGIIAGSRTEKTNAIPGVAIATALMPPLCTAGFGLATNRLGVFGGAFYLFFINAVLISLSTYFIVRLLKFPQVQLMNPAAERKTKLGIYLFLTLLLIPSIVFLVQTVQNATRLSFVSKFIEDNIHRDIDKGVDWTYKALNDSVNELKVYYFGEYIATDSVEILEGKFNEIMRERLFSQFFKVEGDTCVITLIPTDTPPDEEQKRLAEEVDRLRNRIGGLERYQTRERSTVLSEIDSLRGVIAGFSKDTIPFDQIEKEVRVLYPELEEISLSKAKRSVLEDKKVGEQYIAVLKWKAKTYTRTRRDYESRLQGYLTVKLKADTVGVVSF